MPESADEKYVRVLFEQLYGVQLRKIPETNDRTFDFELLAEDHPVAAIEVKTLVRVPRTPENGWKAAPIMVPGSKHLASGQHRRDNGAARVGRAIHEAYKQLSA